MTAAVAVLLALTGCGTAPHRAPNASGATSYEASLSTPGSPTATVPVEDAKALQPAVQVLPGLSTPEAARIQLTTLNVAPQKPMTGYTRTKFTHWTGHGESCDTREIVLQRTGADVQRDAECRAVAGTWTSPYDGVVVTDAAELDIDHVVPLANAWRSGADVWTAARRKDFANDLDRPQLLPVSAATNRGKGDQGPEDWQPPARVYWCTYATAWTNVKAHYRLSVTEAEKNKLEQMLGTCTT